ncbi:AAA family ATPase [Rubritalea tangerina]|uniref:AAA family ATPase n=1 Tax=Rubritalea tangerina TaxID=430798 RepID=A0ABW4ZA39_9BACT
MENDVTHFKETFTKVKDEVSRFIVGQNEIIEDVMISICCGGHVLLEGVPGVGKTSLVNALSKALSVDFKRIQFTPDLLPSDVVGTQVLVDKGDRRELEFQPGPIFCNLLLADEINRATPKTQSALLETMQEKTATVANITHKLPLPFFVMATQNPIENDGTYPLPEAQLDRFFFKLEVALPTHDEFFEILNRTGGKSVPEVEAVASGEDVIRMGNTLREVPVAPEVQSFLVRLVRATHPEDENSPKSVKQFVRNGASPRAGQAMLSAARAKALLDGRFHVAEEDVKSVARQALRHRMILSFEGEAEGIKTDQLIDEIVEQVSSKQPSLV